MTTTLAQLIEASATETKETVTPLCGNDPEWAAKLAGLACAVPEALLVARGVTELTEEMARGLAGWAGRYLFLPDLTELAEGPAVALCGWRGSFLSLSGLRSIAPEALRALHAAKAPALALGLRDLDGTTQAEWAFPRADLHLDRLRELSQDAARNLGGFRGRSLRLDGLERLDTKAAESLAESSGLLVLGCLRELDEETASALVAGKGTDDLTLGVEEGVSDAVRRVLLASRSSGRSDDGNRPSHNGKTWEEFDSKDWSDWDHAW